MMEDGLGGYEPMAKDYEALSRDELREQLGAFIQNLRFWINAPSCSRNSSRDKAS